MHADDGLKHAVDFLGSSNNHQGVIMFISKTMQIHQKNYTIIEKQMLAATTRLKKCEMWIHGRRIRMNEKLRTLKNKFRDFAQLHRKAYETNEQCNKTTRQTARRASQP